MKINIYNKVYTIVGQSMQQGDWKGIRFLWTSEKPNNFTASE